MPVPRLRFKRDDGSTYPEWSPCVMGDFYTERREAGNDQLPVLSVSIHTGVSNDELDEAELGKRVKRIEDKSAYRVAHKGDLVFNMMRAWQGAVGCAPTNGMVSPAYIVAVPDDRLDPCFMNYYVQTRKIIDEFNTLSYGVTDFRKRLYWDSFAIAKFHVPCIDEQKRIAALLVEIDDMISACQDEIDNLEQQKQAMMQIIFSQEVRFNRDDDTEFPNWGEKRLEELLDYEQPTKYIVESAEYDNRYKTPVLTAGQTFILGYTDESTGIYTATPQTPVIIFDDFTTSFHWVNFNFKVKSSAMKILTPKIQNLSFYYIYTAMQTINYAPGEHSRQWISKYSKFTIPFPCFEEQQRIADFFFEYDTAIQAAKDELTKWQELKKGLLQQMFI